MTNDFLITPKKIDYIFISLQYAKTKIPYYKKDVVYVNKTS